MPQLDPAPWFLTLLFSWLVFLVVLPPKVVEHTFPYEPMPQSVEKDKHNSWNWPWH